MSDILVASVVRPASNIRILYIENPSTPAARIHFQFLLRAGRLFFTATKPKGNMQENVNNQRQKASSTGDMEKAISRASGNVVLHKTVADRASKYPFAACDGGFI